MALLNYHWDAGKFLIEAGADVNLWDIYGQTPLYVAVDMNTLPVGRRIELPSMDFATGDRHRAAAARARRQSRTRSSNCGRAIATFPTTATAIR